MFVKVWRTEYAHERPLHCISGEWSALKLAGGVSACALVAEALEGLGCGTIWERSYFVLLLIARTWNHAVQTVRGLWVCSLMSWQAGNQQDTAIEESILFSFFGPCTLGF